MSRGRACLNIGQLTDGDFKAAVVKQHVERVDLPPCTAFCISRVHIHVETGPVTTLKGLLKMNV